MFRRTTTVLAVATTGLVATSLGLSVAYAATTSPPPSGYSVSINQGNVPATAAGYGNQSCDEFSAKDATADGWLFVAPKNDNFTRFEAVFDHGTVFYNDPNGNADSSGVTFPKPDQHLAVVTPAGWTLTNAYAVLDGSSEFFTLSHTCPATDTSTPPPPPATAAAPTAALQHSCDLGGIQVSLGNVAGTAPADFTVSYAGADQVYKVAAGATQTLTVPVSEDTTQTVTVTATGMATQSDTWARNCSTTVPPEQHAINPAVSFATDCTTGITATLSNMQVDDTTTDAVTFSVTTPTGAVEQVVVGANQITKRSYDFADGTTGTVAVVAPGLAKQTKSYAKSCTAVLGEKVTKGTTTPTVTKGTKVTKVTKTPTTAVEGTKATQLPMTGAATGAWLRGALLLLLAGCALSLAGQRPYRPRHAR
jgi:hypothetical protein